MITTYLSLLIGCLIVFNPLNAAADAVEDGAVSYAQTCAACHGETGGGGLGPPLNGCSICDSLQELIVKIESDMPPTDPDACIDDCARNTATYIFSSLNDGTVVTDPITESIDKGDLVIELETVVSGLAAPIDLKSPADGTKRIFVADQAGTIVIIQEGKALPSPFLDLSARLISPLGIIGSYDENDYDERGLLGFAFHPGFSDASSPGFGKMYTYTSEPVSGTADFSTDPLPDGEAYDHQSVIAEWTVDPEDSNRIDPESFREIMRIDQPQFNHDGGALAFGSDQYLYIALGDGGSANDSGDGHGSSGNGQNINTVHGSILRIDPLVPELTPASPDAASANGSYRVPAGNPFVNTEGIDEIYAYGFRNPFRFSFDAPTSRLIAADVGQNTIEEIDIVTKGGNYGWNLKEGTFDFVPDTGGITDSTGSSQADLVDPVVQYDHDDGISIIGGFVYRGSDLPDLTGLYVFGDFSTTFSSPDGRLFYSNLEDGTLHEFQIGSDDRAFGLFLKGFGVDAENEIYILASSNLGPYGTGGVVLKLIPAETSGTGSSSGSCFISTLFKP